MDVNEIRKQVEGANGRKKKGERKKDRGHVLPTTDR